MFDEEIRKKTNSGNCEESHTRAHSNGPELNLIHIRTLQLLMHVMQESNSYYQTGEKNPK